LRCWVDAVVVVETVVDGVCVFVSVGTRQDGDQILSQLRKFVDRFGAQLKLACCVTADRDGTVIM
jgi:hypothetical protein